MNAISKLFPVDLSKFFTAERLYMLLQAAAILVVGFLVLQIISRLVSRATKKRVSAQASMLLRRSILYAGMTIILLYVLQALGVQIGALLGAAGVVGIAIGFASQTSMSNLISGLFLISEKPFAIGDVIRVGERVGIVDSIDPLSVKLRTFDNQFVRIPNEKIISNELTNITRYPIRRMDITMGVAYKDDLERVQEVLLDVADRNPYCLAEPAPIFLITDFGDSSQNFLFGIWFEKSDYMNLKNSIMVEIKRRFDRENIEIPFPHRSLYSGAVTDPFPIRIVNPADGNASGIDSTNASSGVSSNNVRATDEEKS